MRHKRLRRTIRLVVSLGLAACGLYIVYGQRDELAGASSYLDSLRWQWLAVAALVEAASMVSFASLQRRLLSAGHLQLPLTTMTPVILAANSIQNSLPAGPVFSNLYAFRQYRSRGADEVLAGWVLVGTSGLAMLTLVLLATAGLAAASGTGSGLNLVTVILGLVLLSGLVVLAWAKRTWIALHLVGPLELIQRLFKRPEGDARQLIAGFVVRMNAITPTRADWTMATAYALATWLLDLSCLMGAFAAVGAPVPWRALLLAYAAAQLAANLPITPGGLGVVEGSLNIGLVAFGGGQESTVAAVLLYRLLSFWVMLPIGWAAWAATNWQLRRREDLQRRREGRTPAGLDIAEGAT